MAFNGLKSAVNDAFNNAIKLSLSSHQRKILRSNQPINSLSNQNLNFTDVMPNMWKGSKLALRQRIKNNEALRHKFATEPKLDSSGKIMKDNEGNVIGKRRNIDDMDLAMSLFYDKKGDFSFGRAASAVGVGYLGIAGGVRLLNG